MVRDAIIVLAVPLRVSSDESGWPDHGTPGGTVHEDTKEETIIFYDASGSTTHPYTRDSRFCCGLLGLLPPDIFRWGTAVATFPLLSRGN